MNIVFMGTPEYVIRPLESLLTSDHAEIAGVYSQPNRPVGRGGVMTPPPVGVYCRERGLPLFQPASLRNASAHQELADLKPDVVVVAAYGKILPAEVLQIPKYGCLNIHPSLLPRYRGPSPVVTALLEGDQTTGVTVMVVDEGMDSGPVIAQVTTEISPEETAVGLTYRLFQDGGDLMASILPRWAAGEIEPLEQDDSLVTMTRKITKLDGEADWRQPAQQLAQKVRAFDPWPGLYSSWKGKMLKATKVRPVSNVGAGVNQPSGGQLNASQPSTSPPGEIVRTEYGSIAVATGDGLLMLDEVQLEGRRPMATEEFVRGQRDFVGSVLPS